MGTRAEARREATRQRHEARREERRTIRRGEDAGPTLEQLGAALSRASEGPLREARVNQSWEHRGLAALVFTRDRPDNDVAAAWLLVDLTRFGLLYCTATPRVGLGDWRDDLSRVEAALGVTRRAAQADGAAIVAAGLRQSATAGWAPDPSWERVAPMIGPLAPATGAAPRAPLALRPEAELWRREAHRAPDRLSSRDQQHLFKLLSLACGTP